MTIYKIEHDTDYSNFTTVPDQDDFVETLKDI